MLREGFELEIQMETLKILDKVNNFLGYKAIDKIKIKKKTFNLVKYIHVKMFEI